MGTGSELATLDDYRKAGGFNVLAPVVELASRESAVSPYLVESVAAVKINALPASGEIYNDWRYAPERDGLYALSGLGLAKIAAAAGITWDLSLTGPQERVRRPSGHVYLRYRAVGAIRQPNGEWHREAAEKEIDTEDEAEQVEDAYRRKLAAGRARFSEADIPDMVRREVLQLREFILGHAETKAKNRVIRRLLALKQVYTREELERPFAVPRLIYRPDLADPAVAERTQVEGSRAAAALYGEPFELAEKAAEEVDPGQVATGEPDSTEEAPPAEAGGEGGQTREEPPPPPAAQAGFDEAVSEEWPEVAGAGSGDRPPADPMLDSGQHRGKRFSQVAVEDPAWLLGLADNTRSKIREALARAWVAWAESQDTERGGES